MKSCNSCFEEINKLAKVCKHCSSPQTITRFITPTVSLLLALLSILVIAVPHFLDVMNPDEPDIKAVITSPALMEYYDDIQKWKMSIELTATNEGEIAAVYNGGTFTVNFPDGSNATGYLLLDHRSGDIVLKPNDFSTLKTEIAFDERIPFIEPKLGLMLTNYSYFESVLFELDFETFDGEFFDSRVDKGNIAYIVEPR